MKEFLKPKQVDIANN